MSPLANGVATVDTYRCSQGFDWAIARWEDDRGWYFAVSMQSPNSVYDRVRGPFENPSQAWDMAVKWIEA